MNVKALWKTAALIIGLVILADPTAPLPLLLLYAVLVIAAVLVPVRAIPNELLISVVGITAIVTGLWLYLGETASAPQLAGFIILGTVAVLLPYANRIFSR